MLVLGRVLLCISSHWNFPHEVSISFLSGESSYLQRLQWKNAHLLSRKLPHLGLETSILPSLLSANFHPFSRRFHKLFCQQNLEKQLRYIKPWYMCIYLYQFLTSTVGYQFFCTSTRTDCVFVPFSSGFPWKNWYFHRSSETFFHCFCPFQIGMWPTTCRWCKQLLEGNDDWRVPRFPVSRDRKTRDRNGDLC